MSEGKIQKGQWGKFKTLSGFVFVFHKVGHKDFFWLLFFRMPQITRPKKHFIEFLLSGLLFFVLLL